MGKRVLKVDGKTITIILLKMAKMASAILMMAKMASAILAITKKKRKWQKWL